MKNDLVTSRYKDRLDPCMVQGRPCMPCLCHWQEASSPCRSPGFLLPSSFTWPSKGPFSSLMPHRPTTDKNIAQQTTPQRASNLLLRPRLARSVKRSHCALAHPSTAEDLERATNWRMRSTLRISTSPSPIRLQRHPRRTPASFVCC